MKGFPEVLALTGVALIGIAHGATMGFNAESIFMVAAAGTAAVLRVPGAWKALVTLMVRRDRIGPVEGGEE